jgi:hypothetical protein
LLRQLRDAAVLRSAAAAAGQLLLRSDDVQDRTALLRSAGPGAVSGADLFHADRSATDVSDRLSALPVTAAQELRGRLEAQRGDIVYTSDVADLEAIAAYFPSVRVLHV